MHGHGGSSDFQREFQGGFHIIDRSLPDPAVDASQVDIRYRRMQGKAGRQFFLDALYVFPVPFELDRIVMGLSSDYLETIQSGLEGPPSVL
jgi:hypothetical protein